MTTATAPSPSVEGPKGHPYDSLFPRLKEVCPDGGRPGVTYVYALAKNVPHFQKTGYNPTTIFFQVQGHAFVLMHKGRPVDVDAGIPVLLLDTEVDELFAPPVYDGSTEEPAGEDDEEGTDEG